LTLTLGFAAILFIVTIVVSLIGLNSPALIDKTVLRPYWLARKGEWHRLITSGFVHADLGHLIFNMITFWFFAFPLEGAIGSVKFAVLYLLGLVLSDLGTWYKHRNDPNYASLGASGAILAVLFASIVYAPGQSIMIFPIPIPHSCAALRGAVPRVQLLAVAAEPGACQSRCAHRGRDHRSGVRGRDRSRAVRAVSRPRPEHDVLKESSP
jgi:membrane associated rhomboid family serine protease